MELKRLVLERQINEKVVIGNNIFVTPLKVTRKNNNDYVHLLIAADESIPVDRSEIRLSKLLTNSTTEELQSKSVELIADGYTMQEINRALKKLEEIGEINENKS